MSRSRLAITPVVAVWDDHVRFLESCIANLRKQTGCDLEAIVVVDNCSSVPVPASTGDLEIVRSPRRLPLGAARNLGLERVTTELVCFVDVDDQLLPGTFEFLDRRLTARPELVSCACSLLRWYPELDLTLPHRWPDEKAFFLVRYPRAFAVRNAFIHQFPVAGAALHRARACIEAGGLSEIDFAEDWGLANSLLNRGPIELHRRAGRLYRASVPSMGFPTGLDEVQAAYSAVRERLIRDKRTPRATRALMPLIRRYHSELARRAVSRNERELAEIGRRLGAA
jgi:glycosyltransferase involved in cell wall biosynthesis